MIFIYGIIVFLSNIVAVVIPSVVSIPVFNSESINKWETFLSENKVAMTGSIVAFSLPILFCLIYSINISKSDDKLMRNISEIPSVFSLSSVIGWNVYYFIEITVVLYARKTFGILIKSILITSWGYALFSGMTAWTISYLAIEIINRTILLPKVFPQGHLQRSGFSFRPSFKHLMIFCFMVSSFFPIILLLVSFIAVHINNNLQMNYGIIVVSSTLLFIALLITLSLSRLIINPINSLTLAAEKIKDGDYKTKVPVVTADELGILADSFNDMTESLAEKEFMRDTFGKIVDPEVRDYLMQNIDVQNKTLGGETREITVLFCDIRNFTALSEKMEASQVVHMLNKYFTSLGEEIAKHHGIINKYIGDAIMAIFGAPVEVNNSALNAYEAAVDMRQALKKINEELMKEGYPELSFGIGIHTGKVFAGTIGAENRMEYTVIGDTVNTASRLESLCKTYKVDLLLSSFSVQKAGLDEKELKFIDEAQLRGKTELMKIYTA